MISDFKNFEKHSALPKEFRTTKRITGIQKKKDNSHTILNLEFWTNIKKRRYSCTKNNELFQNEATTYSDSKIKLI